MPLWDLRGGSLVLEHQGPQSGLEHHLDYWDTLAERHGSARWAIVDNSHHDRDDTGGAAAAFYGDIYFSDR